MTPERERAIDAEVLARYGWSRRLTQTAGYVTVPIAMLEEARSSLPGGDAHSLIELMIDKAPRLALPGPVRDAADDDLQFTEEYVKPHSLCCDRCKAVREAATAALDVLGASHVAEEGPNARWVDNGGGDFYYDEDLVCTAGCPVCAAEARLRAALEEADR